MSPMPCLVMRRRAGDESRVTRNGVATILFQAAEVGREPLPAVPID